MPSIHTEILINRPADTVWDAARDYGALHTRLVPGFVAAVETAAEADGTPYRLVTFASGVTLKEVIVDIDDAARRLVWTIESPNVRHHNGALQVYPVTNGGCRVVWTADVLPAAMADAFAPSMAAGLTAMKAQFET
jgi:nucleoside-diphosphate-sugar epimerase